MQTSLTSSIREKSELLAKTAEKDKELLTVADQTRELKDSLEKSQEVRNELEREIAEMKKMIAKMEANGGIRISEDSSLENEKLRR